MCFKSVCQLRGYWLENSLFRSTQSTGTVTGFLPGNAGIYATTNNFDYYIANNEFTNLKTGINIPVSTGGLLLPQPFASPAYVNGIFAHRIRIDNNIFSSGTNAVSYMDRAVDMTCPNATPWQSSIFVVPGASVSPTSEAFAITNNTVTNAFRGVSINGSHGFQVNVADNKITLVTDNFVSPGLDQFGIQLNNCLPNSGSDIAKNIISGNSVSFSATPTYTPGGLIFCGDNGYGIASPSVTCNHLTTGYQGFVFDGVNQHAVWSGNTMTVPISRGFVLSHTAAIGTQGSTNTAINNQWAGGSGSWTGSYYGTWVTSGSQAINSILRVEAASSYSPVNNNGASNIYNYALGSGIYTNTAGGGDYTCGDYQNYKIVRTHEEDFDSELPYYRAKTALYRYLFFNDSIRESDNELNDFYTEQNNTSIDKFFQVEIKLYQGKSEDASEILGGMDASSFNVIETNYKTFYTLYLAYLALDEDESFTYDDGISLKNLAELCPGENGPVIYQAIALYNTVYGKILIPDCSEGGEDERRVNRNAEQVIDRTRWDFNLFPNPANNQIIITSTTDNEELKFVILDLSGRIVMSGIVKQKNFISKLEIDLVNGAYFIKVTNSSNRETIKKLIISK